MGDPSSTPKPEKYAVEEWFDFKFSISLSEEVSFPTLKGEELHPFLHQVAGHRFEEGRPGSLVDSHGRFYKPSQSKERGDNEVAFYEKFWTKSNEYEFIKPFFPQFFGTVKVKSPHGFISEYMVLENLVQGYVHPCIMDIKIGRRTWYDGASMEYIAKCLEKDRISTSSELGFRIAGIQLFNRENGKLIKGKRKWCQRLQKDQVKNVLTSFVSSDFDMSLIEWNDDAEMNGFLASKDDKTTQHGNPDLAKYVYAGPHGVLAQLKRLRKWFSTQTTFHFYSSSILIIYEGSGDETLQRNIQKMNQKMNAVNNTDDDIHDDYFISNPLKVQVKCIDFPHVLFDNLEVDANFLFGLDSVIHHLSQIV